MIPFPKEIVPLQGSLKLGRRLEYSAGDNVAPSLLNRTSQDLSTWYDRQDLSDLGEASPLKIVLHRFPALPATSPEMYALIISTDSITMSASSDAGFGHALATLKQLLYTAISSETDLECQRIIDEPRFKWRGLHLDVSRHFFPKDFIIRYLDWMAALKLNVFHWHLTDDQGWRIESLRFPLLTEKGGWRTEDNGERYGGYYTRDEIREVVKYASQLGIEVVPEIDVPGHSLALLSAYPEFSCFPRDYQPISCWGITDDVLCPGNPATLEFLKDIFSEVCELFPGRYFHIGGDEVPTTKWSICPKCQLLKHDHGFAKDSQLQSYMIRELQEQLRSLGKELIAWDEVLEGSISREPIVMIWQGNGLDAARKAATSGNRYILCPNHFLYFDWKPSDAEDEKGAFGVTDLAKVYSFRPEDYSFDQTELLQGGQANLWTEQMHYPEDVRYMLFPRVYALAEVFWTSVDHKDYEDFKLRLKRLEGYL